MRLSDLQSKKIVDINGGTSIGSIIDINISNNGDVESLIVDHGRSIFSLNRESDFILLWSQIEKIGEDFILVRKE